MAAYPPEKYNEQADLKAHYLNEEHMHALEEEEYERERVEDEALLVEEVASCLRGVCPICFSHTDALCITLDDCEVPSC